MDREAKLQFLRDTERMRNARAKRHLPEFVKLAWKVLEPDTPLLWNWHHDLVCEHLHASLLGQIKRLIINIPPRTGTKSTIVTVSFPVWAWVHERNSLKFVFGSYADKLSTKHSVARRNIIESPWFQGEWGEDSDLPDEQKIILSSDQNVKSHFTNTRSGEMVSAGMLGSITGEGGDFVIIDDPQNPKKAESDSERETINEAFDLTWPSRLNDKKTGRIIVVMQRLHDDDLTGHLRDSGYTHLVIPSICEERTTHVFPMSGKVKVREEGDILHPEREGAQELEQTKKDLTSYGFAGQHQQSPVPKGGGMFKPHWWRYWNEANLPPVFDWILHSWDLTFDDDKTADYVVGQVWGKLGAKRFLLHQYRAQADFPATLKAVEQMMKDRPEYNEVLIEKKANGAAVLSTLKKRYSRLIPVHPVDSKEQRAFDILSDVESGDVYLPEGAPWVGDFVVRCSKFPKIKHKDEIDSMTQALSRFQSKDNLMGDIGIVSMTKVSSFR